MSRSPTGSTRCIMRSTTPRKGDLIAVIGKGHEAYRDREGVKNPVLERELIEEYAAEKGIE